ncbi:flagellar hook-length control protein FliK [Clostridiaceae bacterium 35-E11]
MYNILMNFKNPVNSNPTSFVQRKNVLEKTADASFDNILGKQTTKSQDDDYKLNKTQDQKNKQNIKAYGNKKLNNKQMDKTKTVDDETEVLDKDNNVVTTDEKQLLDILELMNSLTGILENIIPSAADDQIATIQSFKLGIQEIQSLLEESSITAGGLKLGGIEELKQRLENVLMDLKISLENTGVKSLLEDKNRSFSQVNVLIDQLKQKIALYQNSTTAENFMNSKNQQNDQMISHTQKNSNIGNPSTTIEVQTHAEEEKSMQQDQKNANNAMYFMEKEQKGFMANEAFKDIPSQPWIDMNVSLTDASKIETTTVSKINFVNILEQVAEKAEIFVGEKNSEMFLQLKPDHLGKLSMKIAVEKGIVIANIVAENQAVKEVLESNFNILKDALNEKGFGIQELNVSVGQNNDFEKQQQFMKSQKKGNSKALSKVLSVNQQEFIEEEQTAKNLTSTNFDYLA